MGLNSRNYRLHFKWTVYELQWPHVYSATRCQYFCNGCVNNSNQSTPRATIQPERWRAASSRYGSCAARSCDLKTSVLHTVKITGIWSAEPGCTRNNTSKETPVRLPAPNRIIKDGWLRWVNRTAERSFSLQVCVLFHQCSWIDG